MPQFFIYKLVVGTNIILKNKKSPVKGVGGGPPPKMTFLLFLMYFLVGFKNPFTELKNLRPFSFYGRFNSQNHREYPLIWKL